MRIVGNRKIRPEDQVPVKSLTAQQTEYVARRMAVIAERVRLADYALTSKLRIRGIFLETTVS